MHSPRPSTSSPFVHDSFLKHSLQLAEQARSEGNHPFGAVLVRDQRILAVAQNTVCTDHDSSAHAEMNLIRRIPSLNLGATLEDCVLYSSTEPCAMCSGAIYWAGIGSVVFGCSNRELSGIAGGGLEMPCTDIFRRGSRRVEVAGPSDDPAYRRIHEGFWADTKDETPSAR